MTSLIRDMRYAGRNFKQSPGFTAAVVISIALGIAANTTVFSLVNGLLFGALPVRNASRLAVFNGGKSMSYADYCDYRDGARSVFGGVAAHFPVLPASIGGRGEPERIWGQAASGNYFQIAGVDFALGRGFRPEEDRALGREAVVVLSNGLWRRRFGADRAVLGKQVVLSGMPFNVIGVTRSGFHGLDRGLASEFWVPLSMAEVVMPDLNKDPRLRTSRNHQWLTVTARLKPGVTREQAVAAVDVIKHRIDAEFHKDDKRPRPMTLEPAGTLHGEIRSFAVGPCSSRRGQTKC
jgi:hypothetical protein